MLYSSVRYNAIRLDKDSVILVQNLAVADILYIVVAILPSAITYIAGKWILGPVYCFINAQIGFIPGSANALTVLLITSYRLWLVTHPFVSVSGINHLKVRIIVIFTWILASAGMVISLAFNSSSTFNPSNGKCMSSVYENAKAGPLLKLAVAAIVMMPQLVITIEYFILCAIAVRKSKGSQGRQNNNKCNQKALVMVCALSGLFILSWVPYVVFTFMKNKNPDISRSLDLMGIHCISINSFVNPILYTLTNKRFGIYVKNLLKRFLSCETEISFEISHVTSFSNPIATRSAIATEKELPNSEVISGERKSESNA